MEKLIELYYEYKLDLLKREMRVNWATEREIEMADTEKVEEEELNGDLNKLSELKPFVKWLVDNDKIDFKKVYNVWTIEKVFYYEGQVDSTEEFNREDEVLMLLAISDTPIEDLISYLK